LATPALQSLAYVTPSSPHTGSYTSIQTEAKGGSVVATAVVLGATVVDVGGITGPISMMGSEKLKPGMLASGMDMISSGMDTLASGMDMLSSGMDMPAGGMDMLSSGMDMPAGGMDMIDMLPLIIWR
jgi:outer membrane murein-binding lipoprotein Lpp